MTRKGIRRLGTRAATDHKLTLISEDMKLNQWKELKLDWVLPY